MKQIITILSVMLSCHLSYSQSKLIKYFNMLPTAKKQGYVISKIGSTYFADAGTGECKVLVDDTNGFLEIVDSGTGGGTLVYQLAIFKKKKNEDFVAVSYYSYEDKLGDGMISSGDFNFYFCGKTLSDKTNDVLPEMIILQDGAYYDVASEISESYSEGEYEYFEIPHHGTTLKFHFGTNQLNMACKENDSKACEIKQSIKIVDVFWDKETSTFTTLKK